MIVFYTKTSVTPTIIAVCNRFINGEDKVDQLRSKKPTRCREKRLDMALFSWRLDFAAINAYPLLKKKETSVTTLREFKRRMADSLTKNEKVTAPAGSPGEKAIE